MAVWEGAILREGTWLALRRLRTDTSGASAAEYAVILALIGVSIGAAELALSKSVACSMDRSAAVVAGEEVDPGHQYGHSHPKGKAKGHRKSSC